MADDEARARFEALETRIAHQERAIEDLSTTVAEQWKQIDVLTKQLARFGDRLHDTYVSEAGAVVAAHAGPGLACVVVHRRPAD